ncbi:Beta-xylosidase, family GH3 [Zostera marina]|uniref:Beta-xylosidase, family GH3 n=1 Tax=Zostera marina TaxID=29655 RepID=A0A0K9PG91_ZOSMR|nr:Beta-xylosidase, family GH3 [Zostera marina]
MAPPFSFHCVLFPTVAFFFFFFLKISAAIPQSSPPKFACEPPVYNHHSFCNRTLPIQLRASSLVSLLTLPEKILLLSNNASSVPRLGIPSYEWWSESLHGVSLNGPGVNFRHPIPSATNFPQVILLASSFNRTLWFDVARAIAVEARAMFNTGQAGVTFWAPNVNVFRDPRWGRGQETPGEDPLVCGEYAVQYVIGFQGEDHQLIVEDDEDDGGDSPRLMLSACCKHYTAYDLEKWGNFTRYTFNAKVTKQDMEDTYQPPFRSCIQEGKASCLMCSYNELNGVPLCADRDLLQMTRDEWDFKGYITSDCNAVATIFEYQNYTTSAIDAITLALKAGVDINCGGYYTTYAGPALESGKITEKDIDGALLNLFTVQLRLGLFDGNPGNLPFGNLGPSNVCTAEHRQLALEAARQGLVLLKNDMDLLPLSDSMQSQRNGRNMDKVGHLAIIGSIANTASKLGGDYSGIPCNGKNLVDAFRSRMQNVSFAFGCIDVQCNSTQGFREAVQLAREAEIVVVVTGLDSTQEGEDLDRVSLLLPGKQADLVASVASTSKKPVVLVLVGGGPIDVSFAQKNSKIGSIIWVGYPGEGPQAIVEAIFGDFNPSGRLPMTWYPESFTSVAMDDMHMRPDPSRSYPGRTYRFYTGPVVYTFGHGLSYSNYTSEFLSAPDRINLSLIAANTQFGSVEPLMRSNGLDFVTVKQIADQCDVLNFTIHVAVKNNGVLNGSHVVLLFSYPMTKSEVNPQKQLVGFERVHVEAGQVSEVIIHLDSCTHLSNVDEKGERILHLGLHKLMFDSGAEHTMVIEI